MKIELDENLGNRGADVLRAAGHDVATVVEEGLSSASDDRLIEACRSERRRLVTLDLDFSNPLVSIQRAVPASPFSGSRPGSWPATCSIRSAPLPPGLPVRPLKGSRGSCSEGASGSTTVNRETRMPAPGAMEIRHEALERGGVQ